VRKFSTLSYLLLFTISSFLISSCQKEPSVDTPPETGCRLAKTYYFNKIGTVVDSLEYTYTGDKLTKASNPYGYFTMEYTNDKITKINYYEPGYTGLEEYYIVAYNADGSMASIKKHYTGGASPLLYSQYDFSYSAGKLVKFDFKESDYNTGQLELIESTTYSYTGNNITRAVETEYRTVGDYIETFDFSYDNNENYFAKNSALLTDFLFFQGPDGVMLPFIVSSNNVTKVYDGYDEYPISYKLDSKNNLFEFNTDGVDSRYLYNCK